MTTIELTKRYAETVPEFREKIEGYAKQAGKTAIEVYSLWRQYCQTCRDGDQSPILFEFERWYADDLCPPAFTVQAYDTALGWVDVSHHANKDTASGKVQALQADPSPWIDGKIGQTRIVAYAERRAG